MIANVRAAALLRSVLTDAEWAALHVVGKFEFTGSMGTRFVLYRERTYDRAPGDIITGRRYPPPHTFNLGIVGQPHPPYGAACFVYSLRDPAYMEVDWNATLPAADELAMLYLTARYAEDRIRAIYGEYAHFGGSTDGDA